MGTEEQITLFDKAGIMLSTPPASEWQWVGLFVAFLGVIIALMALPTVFQMIWGRPKISIKFKTNESDKFKALQCFIENNPINNKFLKFIRVTRQPAYIVCSFSIHEDKTNKIIVEHARTITNFSNGMKGEAGVLYSGWPAIFSPIGIMRDSQETSIMVGEEKITLDKGYYILHVDVTYDNEHVSMSKHVQAGHKASELFWRG